MNAKQTLVRNRFAQPTDNSTRATRVVTVRMPAELHSMLLDESHNRRVSLNQHCLDLIAQDLQELPAATEDAPTEAT